MADDRFRQARGDDEQPSQRLRSRVHPDADSIDGPGERHRPSTSAPLRDRGVELVARSERGRRPPATRGVETMESPHATRLVTIHQLGELAPSERDRHDRESVPDIGAERGRALVADHTGGTRSRRPGSCEDVEVGCVGSAAERQSEQCRGGDMAERIAAAEQRLVGEATPERRLEVETHRADADERTLEVGRRESTAAESVEVDVVGAERAGPEVIRQARVGSLGHGHSVPRPCGAA